MGKKSRKEKKRRGRNHPWFSSEIIYLLKYIIYTYTYIILTVYCKSHSHNVYTGKATLSFSQRSTEYSFPALTMQTSFPIGI